MSSEAKVGKYSDLSTLSSSLWTAVTVGGGGLGISKTCFPNLLQFLDLSYSNFFNYYNFFREGRQGLEGKSVNPTRWQVCIFAVYVRTGGKLLSEKRCPSFEGWEGKREVHLEKELERKVVFLRISFDCICIRVHVYIDAETPTVKTWLADYSPFQCPRIISDDLYLVWK